MFRPEMLQPMGLPEDVRVIAWGLSLERYNRKMKLKTTFREIIADSFLLKQTNNDHVRHCQHPRSVWTQGTRSFLLSCSSLIDQVIIVVSSIHSFTQVDLDLIKRNPICRIGIK